MRSESGEPFVPNFWNNIQRSHSQWLKLRSFYFKPQAGYQFVFRIFVKVWNIPCPTAGGDDPD
jgi:hypothetical protein